MTAPTETPTDILTLPEMCALLRLGEVKVRKLLREGKIPARLDYRWTAKRSDVIAYHERNVVVPSTGRRRGRTRRSP
jgi:hypothetical protein